MSGSTQLITMFARERNAALRSEIVRRDEFRSRPIEKFSINTSITRNASLLGPMEVLVIHGRAAYCSALTSLPEISNTAGRKLSENWSKVRLITKGTTKLRYIQTDLSLQTRKLSAP